MRFTIINKENGAKLASFDSYSRDMALVSFLDEYVQEGGEFKSVKIENEELTLQHCNNDIVTFTTD